MPEYADITAFHEWLNWLEEISNSSYPDYETLMFYEIRDKLDCLPKVIRCKDCKHRYFNESISIFCCENWADGWAIVEENEFCSRGERKDNEL